MSALHIGPYGVQTKRYFFSWFSDTVLTFEDSPVRHLDGHSPEEGAALAKLLNTAFNLGKMEAKVQFEVDQESAERAASVLTPP